MQSSYVESGCREAYTGGRTQPKSFGRETPTETAHPAASIAQRNPAL